MIGLTYNMISPINHNSLIGIYDRIVTRIDMNQHHDYLTTRHSSIFTSLQIMTFICSHLNNNLTYKQKKNLVFWDLFSETEKLPLDEDYRFSNLDLIRSF